MQTYVGFVAHDDTKKGKGCPSNIRQNPGIAGINLNDLFGQFLQPSIL